MANTGSTTCSKCGAVVEGGVRGSAAHWRDAHPGERAASKSKRKPAASLPDSAGLPGASKAANPTLDLGDEGPVETPPDLGPDSIAPAPRRRLRDWLFGGKHDAAPSTSPEPVRKRRGRRSSAERLLGTVWGGGGYLLSRTGVDVPVGRCLQYQAPMAGEVLDEWLAGGWIDDHLLQPIAQRSDAFERVAALTMLPALIAAYERANDEVRPMLEPWIAEAVRAHLGMMAKAAKKVEQRERELREVAREMGAENVDEAVNAVLNSIFAEPEAAPPAPEPEPATA